MTSFQATLTTEPPFSETPWRPGEYALRDAWFPVAHTPTLSNCALHRTVHSQPYFLWRDDGIVRANNNHPGAPHKRPLSKFTEIVRALVLILVTNALFVCRRPLDKKTIIT